MKESSHGRIDVHSGTTTKDEEMDAHRDTNCFQTMGSDPSKPDRLVFVGATRIVLLRRVREIFLGQLYWKENVIFSPSQQQILKRRHFQSSVFVNTDTILNMRVFDEQVQVLQDLRCVEDIRVVPRNLNVTLLDHFDGLRNPGFAPYRKSHSDTQTRRACPTTIELEAPLKEPHFSQGHQ